MVRANWSLTGALGIGVCSLLVGSTSATAGGFEKGPYLQNVTPNSIAVVWESDPPRPGVVRLLTEPVRVIEAKADDVHEVVIDGLEPGSRYRYEVEVDGVTSGGEFATAPPDNTAPFSFIVFGDSRSNASMHRDVVERIRSEVPDFLLGTGDMVNDGESDHDWQRFFEIERDLLRENVMFPSLGNHDRQGRGRTADNFRKYFALPENSPDPERYYAFTYANSRFLILDSNAYSFALTDQTAWIEEQLQAARLDPKIRHIFVSMHHPPYSVSLHGGQDELREAWTPLFERYRVAAVFSGHDHVYSRAASDDVHYFVSGGGGAPLYPRKKRSAKVDEKAMKYFERVNHYLRVHVFGSFVEISAVRSDGSIIETLSFGERPKTDDAVDALLAAVGSGNRAKAPKMPSASREPAQAAAAVPSQPISGEKGGFGWLGVLGGGLVFVAGGALVWAFKQ